MNAAPLILPFQGRAPRIHRSAMISPGVTIIGDVEIGADSSVFYGCVLRGDVGAIRIGTRTNVQDNSVMHVERGQQCVLEGQEIPAGSLAAGLPAKVRRELSEQERKGFIAHAARYVETARNQANPAEALSLEDVYFD